MNMKTDIQIMSPRQLNFVWQNLMFVGPQYETCFMSRIWHIEFWDGSCVFQNSVYTSYRRPPFSAAEQLCVFESWCCSKAILYFMGINEMFPVFCTFLTDFDQISEPVSCNSVLWKPTSMKGMNEFMPMPYTFIVWFGWNGFYCAKVVCDAYFAFMVHTTLR
jgi:hypothetical protein